MSSMRSEQPKIPTAIPHDDANMRRYIDEQLRYCFNGIKSEIEEGRQFYNDIHILKKIFFPKVRTYAKHLKWFTAQINQIPEQPTSEQIIEFFDTITPVIHQSDHLPFVMYGSIKYWLSDSESPVVLFKACKILREERVCEQLEQQVQVRISLELDLEQARQERIRLNQEAERLRREIEQLRRVRKEQERMEQATKYALQQVEYALQRAARNRLESY